MFVDKNSIIINGVNMGDYIVEAKYNYPKLWANDAGRNLAGVMSGTLIGIFPKITLQFRKLTKAELEIITPILDSPRQTVSYYDPVNKAQTTMTTYTGDYEIKNKYVISNNRKNEGFSCSFISTKKRV
ncbi:MAG: hypothetical protein IJ690_02075 [Clostridia bacterium]|nr:hypothetical protein [Clostridia bacterium]MBR1653729.1 hypothetical protein [Clostridia bacterium]